MGSALSKQALGAESGVNVWVSFPLAEDADAHGGATLFSGTAQSSLLGTHSAKHLPQQRGLVSHGSGTAKLTN